MGQLNSSARSAGLLLHITSLPSRFGCGDFGPEAKRFAEFLRQSGQKHWQILPLGQTTARHQHSPYSAVSAMALSKELISPEWLGEKKLLSESELRKYVLPKEDKIDFVLHQRNHNALLSNAFANFGTVIDSGLQRNFLKFIGKHKSWLDDFALYSVLNSCFHGLSWYDWPLKIRDRDPSTLRQLQNKHRDAIREQQWYQFIAEIQWMELKEYCNQLGVSIIGDVPFYVSHDSVDVWSLREMFSVRKNGQLLSSSGVPPDYFSADGQLWGTPVFKWDKLKLTKYKWWISRLRRNMELFDVVRLDHFRAFSAHWAVPAREKTARNGKWTKGPGLHFFRVLQKSLGVLPLIAEDLGDIDEKVLKLRDELSLPGMKVLQFAFGKEMSQSGYIPHNYQNPDAVVYTGTHDNNTVKGWYRKDLKQNDRNRLSAYFGKTITQENVADEMIHLAYESIAGISIIPVQDILGLDERNRMNTPSTTVSNWRWRLTKGKLDPTLAKKISRLAKLYNRA